MNGIDLIRQAKERKNRAKNEAEKAKQATLRAEEGAFKVFLDLVKEVENEPVDLASIHPVGWIPKKGVMVTLGMCTQKDSRRVSIQRGKDWQGRNQFATYVSRERKVERPNSEPTVLIGFSTDSCNVTVEDSMSVTWMSTHDAYQHLLSVLADGLPNV